MNAIFRTKKCLLALIFAAISGQSFATEKDVSRMIDALPTQVQADLLAGTPAQNITLHDGSNLAKNLESVLTTTPQLGYRAMDACELPLLNLAPGVDGVLNVRNACGVPAAARAVALHVQLVPVEPVQPPPIDKAASVGKLLVEPEYVYIRASDVPFSKTSRTLAFNNQDSVVYTSRLCVAGCTSELKVRAIYQASLRFTVIGFYEDVTTIVGETGAQGPQGIQGVKGDRGLPGTNGTNGTNGATGAQGIPGAAVAVTLACLNINSLDYSACSSACGSSNVIQNQFTYGTCTVAEGSASCSRTAAAGGAAACCACRRTFN